MTPDSVHIMIQVIAIHVTHFINLICYQWGIKKKKKKKIYFELVYLSQEIFLRR